MDAKIKDSQQFWLRLQSLVVSLSEKRAQQMDEIFVGRKRKFLLHNVNLTLNFNFTSELMVIEQKAIKVEYDLDYSKAENREIMRSLTNLNVKLDQVSAKLYEKRKIHEKEEVECEIAHQETVDKLKDAEMDALKMEQEIAELGEEIEALKKYVEDKHYMALSWETKFKMAAEAKKMRDEELAKSSEIGIMSAEIHRMEVKYAQLKNMQEKWSKSLEHTVYHRDHIYDAAYVREKKTGTKVKTQSNIKHKVNEMQNKLKIINTELATTQRQYKEFQMRADEIKEEIASKEQDIQTEKVQDCLLQTEIEQSLLLKQQNLENIVKLQKRAKRYRQLQNCTYLPKLKTEILMDAELQRQEEIHENLLGILESLQRDFPAHKFVIEKIFYTLKN